MPTIVQIDFPSEGPFGEQLRAAVGDLAESIAREPGMRWKIWTENAAEKTAGGIYLFETEATARAFLEMHLARLPSFGVTNARARVFNINEPLSRITHAPGI
jgi:hypothetical protein